LGFITKLVMPGLVPGIHVLLALKPRKTWMAGTSLAMTKKRKSLKRRDVFSVPRALGVSLGVLGISIQRY
jgi:hypothetical protein